MKVTRDIYYNYQSRYLSDDAGKSININIELAYKDQPTWVIYPIDDAGDPIDLSGVVAFSANVDADFRSNTGVMCHTDANAIIVVGNGVHVPLDAATARFLTVVDGKETVNAYFDLVGLDGAGKRVFYLRYPIRAGALLNPGDEVPEEAESLYLEKAEAYAILRAEPEHLYSVSGGDDPGHVLQTEHDRYIKYRNSALAGAYSPWVALVAGPQGTPGAIVTLGAATVSFVISESGGVWSISTGTLAGDRSYIKFTKAELNNISDNCEFDLLELGLDGNYHTISNSDTTLDPYWNANGDCVFALKAGTWPTGSFQLKPRGILGRDGDEFERVTVSGLTLTVRRGPKEYYWTATAGTLVIDWSAIGNLDKTIQMIVTMPSPVVSFTWPSVIHWLGGVAPDMSVPGEYHIAIKKYANGIRANLFDEVFP